jgi:hypothetical protein
VRAKRSLRLASGRGWSASNIGSVQQCCEFWKMEFNEELGTWNLMTAGFTARYYGPLSLCTRVFV